jgi:hypothetical protein
MALPKQRRLTLSVASRIPPRELSEFGMRCQRSNGVATGFCLGAKGLEKPRFSNADRPAILHSLCGMSKGAPEGVICAGS